MPRQFRLSAASAYSIYEMYSQDWCAIDDALVETETMCPECSLRRLDDWTVEDVVRWSMTTTLSPDVATWLRQQEVTGQVLRSLDEAELELMGLEPFGRRRQLLLCREEILAEEAAKEKKAETKAESPRTGIRWSPDVQSRREEKAKSRSSDKAADLRALPTPTRALAKLAKSDSEAPKGEAAERIGNTPPHKDVFVCAAELSQAGVAQQSKGSWMPPVCFCNDSNSLRNKPNGQHLRHNPCQNRPQWSPRLRHPVQPIARLVQQQWVFGLPGRAASWMPWRKAVSGFPLEIARAPCPPTSLSWIPYQPNILKIPGASWAPPALPLSVCEGLPGRTLALAHGPASAFVGPARPLYIKLPPRVIGYSVTIRPRSNH
ncbi:unnamed protein product [Durusdinium trenchii]|uniref:Uncharacterized protein n=2 Tax=Durusdinium trenchii TaxID=1381693 RepID=A0ABP0JLS1_9DINO